MAKRKPGGGRKSLSDEPTVKMEITLPQSLKVALVAYAQMRSTQEGREVTVSELVRKAIPDIINGIGNKLFSPEKSNHPIVL
jgi:hypothetical protein